MSYNRNSNFKPGHKYVARKKPDPPVAVKKVDIVQNKEIKSLNRKVTKLQKQKELKYYDSVFDSTPGTSGIAFSLVNKIKRGTNYNQREGDNIYCKKVRLSYILTKPTAVPQPPFQIRMVLMWDLQANGTGAFQMFTGTAPDATQEANSLFDDRAGMTTINSPYYQNTRDRFKILYDQIHVINSDDPDCSKSLVVRKTIPLSGAKVNYTDQDDETSDFELLPQRNLVLLYFCAGSATTIMNMSCRTFFTDD